MSRFPIYKKYFLAVILILFIPACSSNIDHTQSSDEKLKIVVTTTFIADVVGNIAGDDVDLTVLLEPGQNPHSYQITPQDLVKTSDADLIFVNGLGLEEFLDDLLVGSGAIAPVIVVSEGIPTLSFRDLSHDSEGDHSETDPNGPDPHVWFDPNNVIIWTDNITRVLIENDPRHEVVYKSNAAAFRNELIDAGFLDPGSAGSDTSR